MSEPIPKALALIWIEGTSDEMENVSRYITNESEASRLNITVKQKDHQCVSGTLITSYDNTSNLINPSK